MTATKMPSIKRCTSSRLITAATRASKSGLERNPKSMTLDMAKRAPRHVLSRPGARQPAPPHRQEGGLSALSNTQLACFSESIALRGKQEEAACERERLAGRT